jgi:dsRNA-specific ribonuclease
VNNRTQAVVCDDLGMISYALYSNPKVELKTKDRADLLEAFLGALYVDKVYKQWLLILLSSTCYSFQNSYPMNYFSQMSQCMAWHPYLTFWLFPM